MIVQAHSDFFPDDEKTPAVPRMIEGDIPRVRQAIQDETGVFIPGFRIKSSVDLVERGYAILIDDLEVDRGLVPSEGQDPYDFMLARADDAIRSRLPTSSTCSRWRSWSVSGPATASRTCGVSSWRERCPMCSTSGRS